MRPATGPIAPIPIRSTAVRAKLLSFVGDEGTIIVSTCAEIRVLLYDQKAEFGYRARASLRGPEHHMLGIMGAVA